MVTNIILASSSSKSTKSDHDDDDDDDDANDGDADNGVKGVFAKQSTAPVSLLFALS